MSERPMTMVEQIDRALDWLERGKSENDVRHVYIRFAWGEVRALDVIFSVDERWMTVVSTNTDSCEDKTVAPVNAALAVRTWKGPL